MNRLKAQVRKLSQAELGELRTYINGLMAAGGGATASAAGFLLPVFEDCCRRYGLGYAPPSVKALVIKREAELRQFLDRACPNTTAVARRVILATAIDLLYRDLQDNSRVVSPRSLVYGLDRLPALLDRSFPGYAACGELGRIVKKVA